MWAKHAPTWQDNFRKLYFLLEKPQISLEITPKTLKTKKNGKPKIRKINFPNRKKLNFWFFFQKKIQIYRRQRIPSISRICWFLPRNAGIFDESLVHWLGHVVEMTSWFGHFCKFAENFNEKKKWKLHWKHGKWRENAHNFKIGAKFYDKSHQNVRNSLFSLFYGFQPEFFLIFQKPTHFLMKFDNFV